MTDCINSYKLGSAALHSKGRKRMTQLVMNTFFAGQPPILPGSATSQIRVFTQLAPSIRKVFVHSKNN